MSIQTKRIRPAGNRTDSENVARSVTIVSHPTDNRTIRVHVSAEIVDRGHDLNAALEAASTLDVRGAYSVRIDLDGHITLQGDAPNMADLINSLLAKFVTTETRNGANHNEFKSVVGEFPGFPGYPVRIVAVDHEPAVSA